MKGAQRLTARKSLRTGGEARVFFLDDAVHRRQMHASRQQQGLGEQTRSSGEVLGGETRMGRERRMGAGAGGATPHCLIGPVTWRARRPPFTAAAVNRAWVSVRRSTTDPPGGLHASAVHLRLELALSIATLLYYDVYSRCGRFEIYYCNGVLHH